MLTHDLRHMVIVIGSFIACLLLVYPNIRDAVKDLTCLFSEAVEDLTCLFSDLPDDR